MTPIGMAAGAAALVNMALDILEHSPEVLIPSGAGSNPPRPIEAEATTPPLPAGYRFPRVGPSPAEKLMQRSRERAKRARHG